MSEDFRHLTIYIGRSISGYTESGSIRTYIFYLAEKDIEENN